MIGKPLPTKVFGWDGGYRGIEQTLLHSDIAAFARPTRDKLHVLVRIEAEVLYHHPPDQLGATAKCSNPDGLALEIFDCFELWPAL